jgi:hypothetical protein
MSNIDGTNSNTTNGNVKILNATESIQLTGKYQMPTDTPVANEVIQALGTTLPNGAIETHWAIIAGVGDVSSSTSTSVNDEIAVFDATSGKIIKNSNILSSAIMRNPATVALNMNFENIDNVDILTTAEAQFISPTQSGTMTINTDALIQNKLFVARNAVEGLVKQNLRSRGTTTTPLAVLNNDIISRQSNNGHNGTNESSGIQWITTATQNHTLSGSGTELKLQTTNDNSVTASDKITINSQGVAINSNFTCPSLDIVEFVPTINFIDQNAIKKFYIEVNGPQMYVKNGASDVQLRIIDNTAVQTTNPIFADGGVHTNTIVEGSVNTGVTVDEVLMLDDTVNGRRVNLESDNGYMNLVSEAPFAGTQIIRGSMADSTFAGVSSSAFRARGTRLLPTAVLAGDSIQYESSVCHDGTSYAVAGHSIEVKADANIIPGSGGVSYKISTSDVGGIPSTQKLKLAEGGVSIGTDAGGFVLPLTRGNKSEVMITDGLGGVFWGRPSGLFAGTGSTTVNGTTETSIIPAGVGSLSVPANSFAIGNSFLVKFGGTATASNNDTIRFRVKSNTVVLCDFTAIMNPIASDAWEGEIDFSIKTVGGAGLASIHSNGNFTYQSTGGGGAYAGKMVDFENNTTFDTTVANTLSITVEQSAGGQQLITNQCILTRLYP